MKWEKYIDIGMKKQNENLSAIFEKKNEIEFPQEYHGLIKPYQGMSPEAFLIRVGNSEVEVGPVFYFSDKLSKDYKSYEMDYMKSVWEGHYSNLIPFIGAGGSGSCFAMDYSTTPPAIVFINSEAEPDTKKAIIIVANSISEFLDKLEYED